MATAGGKVGIPEEDVFDDLQRGKQLLLDQIEEKNKGILSQ